jgi:hypothetical protein
VEEEKKFSTRRAVLVDARAWFGVTRRVAQGSDNDVTRDLAEKRSMESLIKWSMTKAQAVWMDFQVDFPQSREDRSLFSFFRS